MVISLQTLHQSKHMKKEEFQRPKSVFYNFLSVCVFVEITFYDFAVLFSGSRSIGLGHTGKEKLLTKEQKLGAGGHRS